jgi:hypothetical protein
VVAVEAVENLEIHKKNNIERLLPRGVTADATGDFGIGERLGITRLARIAAAS